MKLVLLIAAALAAACSTTPVPGVCCIGAEDCSRLGLSEDRPCLQGEACVDFHCVSASCQNLGCPAESPICDGDACRGCRLDTECPSGACGDDGACVDESSIVYLDPAGQDTAPCTRSAPCRGLQFGIRQTNEPRNHIVMAHGTYVDAGMILVGPTTSLALKLYIHGGKAILKDSNAEILLRLELRTTIRDLEIEYAATAIFTVAETLLERVQITAGDGVRGTSLKARDVSFQTSSVAIDITGTLDLDRVTITGGQNGIIAAPQSSIQISNLLVHATSDAALDLQGAFGSVNFTTIADTGISSTTASGIRCSGFEGPFIRSSIIWTPASLRPAITGGGCNLLSTIAGPLGVVGAMNVNPLFMNPQIGNYHLSPNSPARDLVDAGPALDFEGDPRPRGTRFDLGADEAP